MNIDKKISNWKWLLLVLIPNVLWGSLFPCIKIGYEHFQINSQNVPQIMTFAGTRFFVSGIIIIAIGLLKKEKIPFKKGSGLSTVLLSALFSIVLHYAFTYMGLSFTDSSKTAILKQLATLLYICFGFLFIKEESFSINKIIGAITGFVGITLINLNSGAVSLGIGEILIILASVCTVVSSILLKKAMQKVPPIMTAGVSQFVGGAVLLVYGLINGGNISFTLKSLPIFVYICAASIIAYCLWNYIIKESELSKLFIIKFSEPLLACVFGWLLLGEDIFKWQYLASFILISAGIIIGNLSQIKNNKKEV